MFISKFCHSNDKTTVDGRDIIISFSYQLMYMHALTNMKKTFFNLCHIINCFFILTKSNGL